MDASLEALRAQVRAQQDVIERLEARLARLEGDDPPPGATRPLGDERTALANEPTARTAGSTASTGDPSAPADEPSSAPPGTHDRRQLLTRAATLTASAVAGGAALALVEASPAAAVPGSFDGNPAVTAVAVPSNGTAVSATTGTGFGVQGIATGATGQGVRGEASGSGVGVRGFNGGTGYGVFGSTTDGIGVSGGSNTGAALEGYSTSGWGVRATGGVAAVEATAFVNAVHVQLKNNDIIVPPPSNAIARTVGAIAFDQNEQLWLCVSSGTPGVWRRLGGAGTAGALTPLTTPVRVYDSRPGNPPAIGTKSPLAAGVARTCDLKANGSGVPAGATAVLLSIVATGTTGVGGGFLSVYRNGIAWPGTSNLNWSGPNENIAVTTLTAVDANAICNLYASQATNVAVDVLGYYR